MAKSSSSQSGTNSLAAVVGVVMAIIGFGVGYFAAETSIRSSAYDSGYRAGSADARKKAEDALQNSGLLPKTEGPVSDITATVKAVTASTLTVETPQLTLDPFAEKTPTTRTIAVNEQTRVYKLVPLTPEEMKAAQEKFAAALAAYGKSATPAGTPPAPPETAKRVDMKISDIAEGDVITVHASGDIRAAATFTALEIGMQPATAAPAPAPIAPPPAPTK